MRRVLVALAVLGVVVGAAGCGGKKTSAPPDTTAAATTTTSVTATAVASAQAFSSVRNCQKLQQLGAEFSRAITANGGSTSSQAMAKAYANFADHAPKELRSDFKTLSGAFKAYLEALTKAGYKPGSTPTTAELAALANAAKSFTSPKMQAAEQHLTAWVQHNCSSG